jgi:hypothetical protein
MDAGENNYDDPNPEERAIQREELLLFRSFLDVLAGASQSKNAVKREAATRLATKLKRALCATGLAGPPPRRP